MNLLLLCNPMDLKKFKHLAGIIQKIDYKKYYFSSNIYNSLSSTFFSPIQLVSKLLGLNFLISSLLHVNNKKYNYGNNLRNKNHLKNEVL